MSDLEEKKALSDAARILLDDPAFSSAVLSLRKRWFGQLMEIDGNTLRQAELCSMLRALESIPAELGTLINDYRMALKRQPPARGLRDAS